MQTTIEMEMETLWVPYPNKVQQHPKHKRPRAPYQDASCWGRAPLGDVWQSLPAPLPALTSWAAQVVSGMPIPFGVQHLLGVLILSPAPTWVLGGACCAFWGSQSSSLSWGQGSGQ